MQSIINILASFFRLTGAAYNRVDLEQAKKFHSFYVGKTIWFTPIIIGIMIGLNYFGFKWVNLLIALFMNLVVLTLVTRPEALLAAIISSITFGAFSDSNVHIINDYLRALDEAGTEEEKAEIRQKLNQTTADILKDKKLVTFVTEFRNTFFLISRTIGDVIFWISIFGLFLGTISCRNNPGAVLTIAVALIVIGYASYRWNMGPTVYKWIIYNYAVVTLVVSILSLVSAPRWIQLTGHDIGSIFRISETSKAFTETNGKVNAATDESRAAKIRRIGDEIIACDGQKECLKNISTADITFWLEVENDIKKDAIPSKIGERFSQISLPTFGKSTEATVKAEAPAPPAPAPAQTIVNYITVAAPSSPLNKQYATLEIGSTSYTVAIERFDNDKIILTGELISLESIDKTSDGKFLTGNWHKSTGEDGQFKVASVASAGNIITRGKFLFGYPTQVIDLQLKKT